MIHLLVDKAPMILCMDILIFAIRTECGWIGRRPFTIIPPDLHVLIIVMESICTATHPCQNFLMAYVCRRHGLVVLYRSEIGEMLRTSNRLSQQFPARHKERNSKFWKVMDETGACLRKWLGRPFRNTSVVLSLSLHDVMIRWLSVYIHFRGANNTINVVINMKF